MAYYKRTYHDEYDEAMSEIQEDMEDMAYEEKVDYAMLKVQDGMEGFQEAMATIVVMAKFQEERIKELERTGASEKPPLHTAMFLVCVLFYVYGSFFGLYMCRK